VDDADDVDDVDVSAVDVGCPREAGRACTPHTCTSEQDQSYVCMRHEQRAVQESTHIGENRGEEKEEKKKKRKEKKRKEKKRKKKEKKKKKTVGNDDRVLAVPERSRLPAADGDRTARSPR